MAIFAREKPIIGAIIDPAFAGRDGWKFFAGVSIEDGSGDFECVWAGGGWFGAAQRFFGGCGGGDVERLDGWALFEIDDEIGFVRDDSANEMGWVGGVKAGVIGRETLAGSVNGEDHNFARGAGEMELAERAGFGGLGVTAPVAAEENWDVRELDG